MDGFKYVSSLTLDTFVKTLTETAETFLINLENTETQNRRGRPGPGIRISSCCADCHVSGIQILFGFHIIYSASDMIYSLVFFMDNVLENRQQLNLIRILHILSL